MQAFLTFAAEFVAVSGFALFVIAFVSGYSRWKSAPAMVLEAIPDVCLDMEAIVARLEEVSAEVAAAKEVEAIASQLSALWVASAPVKPAIVDAVVPFIRPQPKSPTVADLPDWSALDPFQLRKECQARGIKWRNADPLTGKHLKKAAMVAALKAMEAIAV
jgi:hypothetical protein